MGLRLRWFVCLLPFVCASACAKSVLVLGEGGVADVDAATPPDSGVDAGGAADAGSTDAGSGCSPTGVWSDGKGTIVFNGNGTFTATPNPHTAVSGTFTFEGGQLAMTNATYTTTRSKGDACIGVVGAYTATFDVSCSHVTLNAASDPCAHRAKRMNGLTMTRR